ncbi:protein APCDD1-like [Centruroides vittatus]|uniref:protein APCDD1-like n=1 Tax=Centruroides vittatus TaxID=120091 RepID=UPI0035100683
MDRTLFSFLLILYPSLSECFLSGSQNSECHQWKEEFARNQATVTSKVPPDVLGKWVSESCEVRPGPDFLLRRYQFFSNKTFVLHQFYYMDDSCTLPAYSIIAWGHYHLSRASWIVPGAMETDYVTTRVNLIAYSSDVAESLAHRINRSCPNHIRSNWRPYKRYRIYSYVENGNGSRNDVIEDYDCLSSLHITFNELQLMRVEHRKALHHRHKPHPTRIELFLGDVHNDVNKRNFYRPTSYQAPLLNSKSVGCHVCHLVSKSHELSPPQLPARPRLPVYLNGEWISTRCEIRPLGMFLTRQLQFNRDNWKGSYQYYADPNCATPTFLLEAEGKFVEIQPSNKFAGATEYNFNVYRGFLTLQKDSFVAGVNRHSGNLCGRSGSWEANVTQDVTSTGGCLNLGIRIPSLEYNVVRIDIDHHGNSLLYLGKLDTDFRPTSPSRRPTSYQLPLVQCRHISDNHLNPIPHALYLSSSCQSSSTINIVILFVFWILRE